MVTQSVGIGIVGSGLMGQTYAEIAARHHHNAHLAAVAGGRRAAALAARYGVGCEPSVEHLIGRTDVDAVIITTPEATHLGITRLAAAARKHVLVEKPMAPDVAQCEAMDHACRAAGVVLMVVQSQRFRGVNRRAKRLLDEGAIGALWQVRCCSLIPLEATLDVVRERPWMSGTGNGGTFLSQTVHSFDLLRWLAGSEAQRIFAFSRAYGDHALSDLSTMAQVEFASGVMAQLWASYEMPGMGLPQSRFRFQLVGEKGALDFDGYSSLDLVQDGAAVRVWEQQPFDALDPLDPVRLESFTAQNQAFVDAVVNGTRPPVTAEDGRAAVELCQAALQSARTGDVVRLPLGVLNLEF
ncbi:MAG: Gfo/Idh/MocA family oxidoreductase [Ardenticatenaceae bacterium]|nr:Gfo/Idh/MocA family oxidoreductase [Ardenticatenaceae bacterium]